VGVCRSPTLLICDGEATQTGCFVCQQAKSFEFRTMQLNRLYFGCPKHWEKFGSCDEFKKSFCRTAETFSDETNSKNVALASAKREQKRETELER
jgi:hypothetical protein